MKRFSVFLLICCLVLSGCVQAETHVTYDLYETSFEYGITRSPYVMQPRLFAEDLCLTAASDRGTEGMEYLDVAYAAGLFNRTTQETIYAENMNERIYPASTTKVLTAYVALTYGNPDDIYTVSAHATDQPSDASLAYLHTGDRISLRQLLYGLLLPSGNDAAVAIAEGVAGSEEAFLSLMNQEAAALGATHSHFVTVNGLHDDDHYTTVYDMYLILNAALELPEFVTTFCASTYDAVYEAEDGSAVSRTWNATTWYLSDRAVPPDGIRVLGGKTGTTYEALNCLVLLAENSNNDQIIAIIFKASTRAEEYDYMNEILEKYADRKS